MGVIALIMMYGGAGDPDVQGVYELLAPKTVPATDQEMLYLISWTYYEYMYEQQGLAFGGPEEI